MTIFDPTYGELLSAKEVSEATTLTMNQLRNWRMPSRLDKAPFGVVYIGASPYYRKASVQRWLEQNEGSNVRYVPAGTDLEIPINESVAQDNEKAKALRTIAEINSENAYDLWYTKFNKMNPELAMSEQRKHVEWWSKATGKPSEGVDRVPPMMAYESPQSSEVFFIGFTLAMRSVLNQIQNLGLTDEEIISIPVGDVPPIKK